MSRPLQELVAQLERRVDEDDARRRNYDATREQAKALARRLPLVHRTGSRDDWRQIFHIGRLDANNVPTAHERKAGRVRSVYFFFGACAYDRGHVAILLAPQKVLASCEATFSPFDTGGMRFCRPAETWNDDQRYAHLAEFSGSGEDVPDFAGPYLAAHFRQPGDYVRSPQRSVPDFPPYHQLRSTNDDRRAWTIEVQCHDDIGFSPDPDILTALVVRGSSRVFELPPRYVERARLLPDDLPESDFTAAIADTILGGSQ